MFIRAFVIVSFSSRHLNTNNRKIIHNVQYRVTNEKIPNSSGYENINIWKTLEFLFIRASFTAHWRMKKIFRDKSTIVGDENDFYPIWGGAREVGIQRERETCSPSIFWHKADHERPQIFFVFPFPQLPLVPVN